MTTILCMAVALVGGAAIVWFIGNGVINGEHDARK